MRILVVCTLMENERFSVESVQTLKEIWNENATILFIIQGQSIPQLLKNHLPQENFKLVNHSEVSHSRNLGIDFALNEKFDLIHFHDSTISVSKNFWESALQLTDDDVLNGAVVWGDRFTSLKEVKTSKASIHLIEDGYVWSYIFPVKKLTSLRFNTQIGPGSKNGLNSGEDVLFLRHFFKQNKMTSVFKTSAEILHPPRLDHSKQLSYARGQGALYRYLIQQCPMDYRILKSFILFVMNSFLGPLIFRPHSVRVFKERWRGFFSKDVDLL